MTTPPGVQLLFDKQEIHDVLMRYCRGVDRCDEELLRSVYHEDAFDEHGPYRCLGQEFARTIVDAKLRETVWTMHAVNNLLIEVNGDEALSEAVFVSYQQAVGDDRVHIFAGRYLDEFSRRNGRWGIANRVVVHDWSGSARLAEWALPSIPPELFTQGARGDRDISVAARQRLLDPQQPGTE